MSINLQRWIDIHCFGSKLKCWEMILTLVIFCSPWQLTTFFFLPRFWQSVCWRTAEDDVWFVQPDERSWQGWSLYGNFNCWACCFQFLFRQFKRTEMWSTIWNVFTSDLRLKFGYVSQSYPMASEDLNGVVYTTSLVFKLNRQCYCQS